jgi:hypothetical protein
MNLSDVFETLLEQRTVALLAPNKAAAASPRVSLLRKFKDYKQQMTALGFLDPTLEDATVCLEWNEENKVATFFLRPKKQSSIDYQIVTVPAKVPNATQV